MKKLHYLISIIFTIGIATAINTIARYLPADWEWWIVNFTVIPGYWLLIYWDRYIHNTGKDI